MPTVNNSLPYEIIAAPFKAYYALVGTAFPLPSATPSASWTLIGSAGDLNYSDEGVTVELSQSIELFRALGDSGSRKAFRTEEDLKIRFILHDLLMESAAMALNGNTITTTSMVPSIAGRKKIGLSRGLMVNTVALLVRGPSPYMDDGAMQFEVPRAAQTGNPELVFRRDTPAGWAMEFTALVDPNASSEDERFGRLVSQTSDIGT